MSTTPRADLAARAAAVLRANDLGGWTKAAPRLYPHQWSWDSAFIAIGLAHLDPRRALRELETLFAAQWGNGMVPHIVFNPDVAAGSYFPDAERWASADAAASAPRSPATSGICQPPVHAIALRRIWHVTERADEPTKSDVRDGLRALYPRLVAWHRYLWLVELLKRSGYDDAAAAAPGSDYPFRVKDVLFSAILVAANDALLALADLAGASDDDRREIETWRDRGRRGLVGQWHRDLRLCLDQDLRTGSPLVTRTVAGFAPLVAGGMDDARRAALLASLDSPAFLGHQDLRWPLPPSTSPDDPGFRPRSYWRGPVWPFLTWLLWWALARDGERDRAARLRRAALDQLAAIDFAEYVEPFTGELLGSLAQSWTAAVTLDWLAAD